MSNQIRTGATIKALREKDGWTLGKFASALGVSHSYMSNIEAGRKRCTPALARSIADLLDIPLAAITTGRDKSEIVEPQSQDPERVLSAAMTHGFERLARSQAAFDNPCTLAESMRFARILRRLLAALDREIVDTAIFGESLADLLDTERQEVERVRQLLHRRIGMRSEPSDLRSRGLAVLDALADEFDAAALHDSSPCSVCGASSVGEADRSAGGDARPSTVQAEGREDAS